MYIPKHFEVQAREEMLRFMGAFPFALIVSTDDNGLPVATHLPTVVIEDVNTLKLIAHMARANPQWQSLGDKPVLVIFHGPHAYISPSHYNTKENVPTWNYTAVHCYGTPKILSADSAKLVALTLLFQHIEPDAQKQWDGASDDYRRRLLDGMIGLEIVVTRMDGKYKMSQNRADDEQSRIAEALAAETDTIRAGVGNMMKNIRQA
jgi:transcriptional regulator